MIRISNLNFSYETKDVLRSIQLHIPKNQVLALMGANAAGKTTLLKCITALIAAESGNILIDGKDIQKYSRRELARKITYVGSHSRHTFSYTIADYVAMGRSPHQNIFNSPCEFDLKKAENILNKLGIKNSKHRSIKETSSGEAHLIRIARAINQDTDIIIMDEPTTYLDFTNKHIILSLIKKLREEEGKTICLSLHDPGEVLEVADCVAVLRDGNIIAYGATKQILTEEFLTKFYNIPIKIKQEHEKYFVYSL